MDWRIIAFGIERQAAAGYKLPMIEKSNHAHWESQIW